MTEGVRQRVRTGDLLEIHTPKGHSYVQYIGKHPEYGDVIRVLPGCHSQRPTDFSQLIGGPSYLAFYSVRVAVNTGFAEKIETFNVPADAKVPTRLRRAGARSRDGRILSWIIECDGHETVEQQLSEVQRQLPIAAIWDHELLVLRIVENWLPDQEG